MDITIGPRMMFELVVFVIQPKDMQSKSCSLKGSQEVSLYARTRL